MIYSKLSTASLKDFHEAIRKCLDEDESTQKGQIKPYGVREYPDWKEHLDSIEVELGRRPESFTSIVIGLPSPYPKPKPFEHVLYERIKTCLHYEDNLPAGTDKPYGVREFTDWKEKAGALEKVLGNLGFPYTKIQW